MAKLTKDQILERVKNLIGEDTSDEALQFIEDVSDTINDYEAKTKNTDEWEKKYKENDEQWRKKYKERFFNGPVAEEEPAQESPDLVENESLKNLKYENLFKEENT